MSLQDTLLAYHDWLDAQGDAASDTAHRHLVAAFLDQRPEDDKPEYQHLIDDARDACAAFVERHIEPGSVMTSALLVFETSKMITDNTDVLYKVDYAALTDSSLTTCAGLFTMGYLGFKDNLNDSEDDDGE